MTTLFKMKLATTLVQRTAMHRMMTTMVAPSIISSSSFSTISSSSAAAASVPLPPSSSVSTTKSTRYLSSGTSNSGSGTNPLDAFRDTTDRETRMREPVGRSWTVKELRRKSYEDLHKLWYVLYKEKNMLLTELQLSRRRQLIFPQPERMRKVQKSMGAIRQVLGERKRVKVAQHASDMEAAMNSEGEDNENYQVDGEGGTKFF